MARDPMVEVELVAAPGSPSGGTADVGAPVEAAAAGPEPARARRRRRLLVAGVATVVAGLVATQAVLDARERAAYARVADVPGVLLPVGDGLEPLWPADRVVAAGEWAMTTWNSPLARSDGVALGAAFDDDGVPRAGAFDGTTGEVLWSVPLAGAEPLQVHDSGGWWIHCDVTTGGRDLLACLVPLRHVPAEPVEDDDPAGTGSVVATAAELVVLDAHTRAEVLRVEVEPTATFTLLGDLVVTARAAPDLSTTVAARDLLTGAEEWSRTTPPGTARAPRHGDPRESTPRLATLGETLLVQHGTSVERLAADGTLVSTAPVDVGEQDFAFFHVARERLAVLQVYAPGSGSGRALVLDPDGAWVELPDSEPVRLTVDDGSEPDLLLLSGRDGPGGTGEPDGIGGSSGLVAWDVREEEVRWSLPSEPADAALVLDGTVYLSTTQGTLVALDLEDGTELWRAEPGPDEPWPADYSPGVATDGRILLLLRDRNAAGAAQVPTATAFAIGDGRRLWSQALPDGIDWTTSAGRVLLGRGGDEGLVRQAFG